MMQTMKLTRQLIKPDTTRKQNTAEGLLPGGNHAEVAGLLPPKIIYFLSFLLQNLHQKTPKWTQKTPKKAPKPLQNLYKKGPKWTKNLYKTSTKKTQNGPKTSTKPLQNLYITST